MSTEEKNRNMALACAMVSIIGLAIMLVSDTIDDALRIKIGEVEGGMVGEQALLCGTVKSLRDNGKGTVFMNLSDETGSISAVFFRDVKEETDSVRAGANVCIEGNIQIYRSMPEIIGKKIMNNTFDRR